MEKKLAGATCRKIAHKATAAGRTRNLLATLGLAKVA
jgi:hypothetical protein